MARRKRYMTERERRARRDRWLGGAMIAASFLGLVLLLVDGYHRQKEWRVCRWAGGTPAQCR
jgi:hypothetical protein